MEISNFRIVLDNPSNTYTTGEKVTGKILMHVSKKRQIHSLNIEVKGVAEVEWTRYTHPCIRRRNSILNQYRGKEIIYSHNQFLVDDFLEIEQGNHTFLFNAHLPRDMPSSFEGKHGFIRYMLTATLQRSWRFNQQTKLLINLLSPINLNHIEKAKQRNFAEADKTYGCFNSGYIEVFFDIPFSGFISGQSIPINISIDNTTKFTIRKITIGMYEAILFRSQYPSASVKEDINEVTQIELESVGAYKRLLCEKDLIIPDMLVLNLKRCTIIQSNYYLQMRLVISRLHKNIVLEIPIYIGTIPLNIGSHDSIFEDENVLIHLQYKSIPQPTYSKQNRLPVSCQLAPIVHHIPAMSVQIQHQIEVEESSESISTSESIVTDIIKNVLSELLIRSTIGFKGKK